VQALVITFTGSVPADFPSGPGVFISTDGAGDVAFTQGNVSGPTGWDILDVRFAYDVVSDTAYFGGWWEWEGTGQGQGAGGRGQD
jgi:hypothetical protein